MIDLALGKLISFMHVLLQIIDEDRILHQRFLYHFVHYDQ